MSPESAVVDDVEVSLLSSTSTGDLEHAREIQKIEDELRARSPSRSRSPSPAPGERNSHTRVGSIDSEGSFDMFFRSEMFRTKRSSLFGSLSLHTIFKYPILGWIGVIVLSELWLYFLVRMWVLFWERIIVGLLVGIYSPQKRKRASLFNIQSKATSYDEWKKIAQDLDLLQNKEIMSNEYTGMEDTIG